MRPIALALLLASAAAGGAVAQPGDARLERLDPAARAAVVALLDSAQAARLPSEPLVQKALEGTARGADAERIVAVVRLLAGRLAQARSALGERSTDAELEAGAAALHAGYTPRDLQRFRRSSSGSVALPLIALADMVERGVERQAAGQMVLELLRARVPADAYLSLQRTLAQDVRSGAQPTGAARTRTRGILLRFSGGSPPR